ncbi:hypothetical protein [Alysiella crassa]|uniref:Uncharacterized protein n=1 Tax=Alysiella crassa TaxID=153491 RepID=A0A376BUY7_9NEIS|nr:hypothetical protein [Alysiella crassa]UOP06155.1 hypothetical protein LVJ80_10005 [Alysiella crassa]SSY80628.1 Uncharacterised protein [Alysiella crassa]
MANIASAAISARTTVAVNPYSAAQVKLHDDGNGGLWQNGSRVEGASVNYETGEIRIPKQAFKHGLNIAEYTQKALQQGAPVYESVSGSLKTTTDVIVIAPPNAQVSWISSPDTRRVSVNVDNGSQIFDILQDVPYPRAAVLNSWLFEVGGKEVFERDGVLYQDLNVRTGEAKAIGTLNPLSGKVILNEVAPDRLPEIKVLAGIYTTGDFGVKTFTGHTAAAPIKPRSFYVYAEIDGKQIVGESLADGKIQSAEVGSDGKKLLDGTIDYETGFFKFDTHKPISPLSVRYSAVSQAHIPLSAERLGINPTRLPSDGRVPIFRAGDYVIISNAKIHDLGSTHSAGQTIKLPRENCDRVCVLDADGKHVSADKYLDNLDNSTITWNTPLDLGDYTLPLKAVMIWEEDNRVVGTDISGSLKLQDPISRDYPIENTYVSSAVVGGDLQTRFTEPFTQINWHGVWEDARNGNPTRGVLNVKDYPLVLTSDGAIEERWRIEFRSPTQIEVYGENLGLIWDNDVNTDVAPINPATDQPYFTLPKQAFGMGGWEAGNCIRFNTFGTMMPVWFLRVIQPHKSARNQDDSDGFRACLRGNTEIL